MSFAGTARLPNMAAPTTRLTWPAGGPLPAAGTTAMAMPAFFDVAPPLPSGAAGPRDGLYAAALAATWLACLALAPAAAPGAAAMALVGGIAGVASGLLGVGGGFLVVPALALAGLPLPVAIGTSFLYVAATGAGAAWRHVRGGTLDREMVAALAPATAIGAQVGAVAAALLPAAVLALGFSAFLAWVALQLGRTPATPTAPAHLPGWREAAPTGVGVGMLCGLFGVGGGLPMTTAQVRRFGVPLKRAIANTTGVVFATGLAGLAAHAPLGHVDWVAGAWLVGGGMVGVRLGVRGLGRVPEQRLKAGMFGVLALMAAWMVAHTIAG